MAIKAAHLKGCVFGSRCCCRLVFGCRTKAAGVVGVPRYIVIPVISVPWGITQKMHIDQATFSPPLLFFFKIHRQCIFLWIITYITDSGLHYLQACLLLQLLLLLNCTGDRRQKQRRCWVPAADDKVADFSVPEAEQHVSETENDARMLATAWVRCQAGHRKCPPLPHARSDTHTHIRRWGGTRNHCKSSSREAKQSAACVLA